MNRKHGISIDVMPCVRAVAQDDIVCSTVAARSRRIRKVSMMYEHSHKVTRSGIDAVVGRGGAEETPRTFLPPRQPIVIVRLSDLRHAVPLSRALVEGGIRAIEFTLTNRTAVAVIEQVRKALNEEVLVGAGTVLEAEDARRSILAGAQFLVTPTHLPAVIACGREHGVPVVCGAFTPTEILTAWQSGATLVKVFPAGRLGPAYIKDIRGPLPDIPLVPTGGMDLHNCADFLDAGAYTVAVGSSLVDQQRVDGEDWPDMSARARRFVEICAPRSGK